MAQGPVIASQNMNALNSLLRIVKGLGEEPTLSAAERARMQSFEEEVHMALDEDIFFVTERESGVDLSCLIATNTPGSLMPPYNIIREFL